MKKKDSLAGKWKWNLTPFEEWWLGILNWFIEFFPEPDKLDFRTMIMRKRRGDLWDAITSFLIVLPTYIPVFPDQLEPNTVDVWANRLDFTYPYNPAVREKVIRLFEACDWRVTKKTLDKGSDVIQMDKDDEPMGIELSFSRYQSGSTCQRIKIGTRMVEEDVYDIICNEAALEMQEKEASSE